MAENTPQTAENPKKNEGTATASLPFPIASRAMSRFSFTETVALAAGIKPITPIQIPAVGYLRKIALKFTFTGTGGSAWPTDGPASAISRIELRNAAGNPLFVPMTGYQLYLWNKWAHPTVTAPYCAPYLGEYTQTAGTAATFYLDLASEIDPETGLGSIPALASNRNYQLVIDAAPYTFVTGGTAGTLTVEGVAHYWSEPPASSTAGVAQETTPQGLGTVHQVQIDNQSVNPGDKYVKLNNVGNFMRNIIFVLRNAAGARVDTSWPALSELYLDNEPMFYLPKSDWRRQLRQQYGYTNTTQDAANGLDNGVFVLPFDALLGSTAGDPANSRSQYLPTLDSSQLQLRGTNYGADTSTLEIITSSVIPRSTADIYSK